MSEDEFDQLPDLFSGIDWNTVPGLSTVPPASQPSASTSGSVPSPVEPRYPTPLAIGRATSSTSTQYSFDEWDASFLDDLNKAEQGLLQKQVAGGLFSREDRGEETSTRSNSRSATTSRYFHGEEFLSKIAVVRLIHSLEQSCRWRETFPPHILSIVTPQQRAPMNGSTVRILMQRTAGAILYRFQDQSSSQQRWYTECLRPPHEDRLPKGTKGSRKSPLGVYSRNF